MRTQGCGAFATQPVGPSGQLEKEQTLTNAEDLFSRYGVGLIQSDSGPHAGTCSVGVELLEYGQEQDGGITETISEAPGAYGSCGGSHAAGAAPYETASTLAPWPSPEVGMAARTLWTGPQLHWHINCLELLAVHLALNRLKRRFKSTYWSARTTLRPCCVHQPKRWSTLPLHVATPLESESSEVASRHSHSGLTQPCSQQAVTS